MSCPSRSEPIPRTMGCFDVYFCHHRFMRVDLRALSEHP